MYEPYAAHYRQHEGQPDANVAGTERAASLVGGGLLLYGGLRRGGVVGLVQIGLGALALSRGWRKRCELKAALEPSAFERALGERWGWSNPTAVQRSLTINRPRAEVFEFCTDPAHLRDCLPFVDRIETDATGLSHWHATGPLNRTLSWTLEETERRPGELLFWSTVPGTRMAHKASLSFMDTPDGTRVTAMLACEAPSGKAAHALAQGVSRFTAKAVELGLKRLKQRLEGGLPHGDTPPPANLTAGLGTPER